MKSADLAFGGFLVRPALIRHDSAVPSATIVRTHACERGTSVSMRTYSLSVCPPNPSGPTQHKVGAPIAAVKPESAQLPANSPSQWNPVRADAAAYTSNSRAAAGLWVNG